ncbi:hypothetical protein V6X63_10145 [Spiribacter sp. 221]|uniref:hypothetical protein n=1 Tax=Spiribacter onubensis TaxID=3122420 RepID=UPI00349F9E9B
MAIKENTLPEVSGWGRPVATAVLVTVAVVLCFTAGAAQAFTDKIQVGNKFYYIDYSVTSYNQSSTALEDTAWWRSTTLAGDLARASDRTGNAGEGAYFLYSSSGVDVSVWGAAKVADKDAGNYIKRGGADDTFTYAIQAQAPTFVPEIDGAALSQGALVTGALGLWVFGRRREPGRSAR